MRIKVKTFGPLRRLIGNEWISLELPENATVNDVVEALIERWGVPAKELLMDEGRVSGNLIFMLNMKDVSNLGGIRTALHPDDEIIILPHVQGG